MIKKSVKILREHPVNKKRIEQGKKPATSIWPWGEGTKPQLEDFYNKFGKKASVISAVDLIKGIAILAGMNSIDVEGANGNHDTNYKGKADAAFWALTEDGSDFVYLHLEGPDECGHRGEADNKKYAVEMIDEKVIGYLKDKLEKAGIEYKMMILPDHPTPIKLKTHVSDPVPYIIYDSRNEIENKRVYNEKSAQDTGVYVEQGYTLMEKFLSE